MRIAGIYSFNQGKEAIETDFATELQEVKGAIAGVDATKHKTKVSQEKTMPVSNVIQTWFIKQSLQMGVWQSRLA